MWRRRCRSSVWTFMLWSPLSRPGFSHACMLYCTRCNIPCPVASTLFPLSSQKQTNWTSWYTGTERSGKRRLPGRPAYRPTRYRYGNTTSVGECRHCLVTISVDCLWPSFSLLSLAPFSTHLFYYATTIMDLGTSSTEPERPNVKYESEEEMEEDVLADYFEKSASAVRHTFAR